MNPSPAETGNIFYFENAVDPDQLASSKANHYTVWHSAVV